MIGYEEQKRLVSEAVNRYKGRVFTLKGFPGDQFRVSETSSYWSDHQNQVLLYTERRIETGWVDFAKGTEEELRQNIWQYLCEYCGTCLNGSAHAGIADAHGVGRTGWCPNDPLRPHD